ncbi:rab geranylgeranyl transferase escort protein-like protein [Byssothecium circinans]|uniref:Rab proteins geranylgeranyltransferase n=1 Tax=Byssothecium circinans TaxID=147558 RepID=A0A6A5UDF7_9PLEO|nr:rab geranylgeranyl transferase escort protein-like protein [Byssothecium circinans]
MDTLDKTDWDVLIVGTGLQHSLLALALSRSGKKILHIDENNYYGGAEAALSLQEAESWVHKVNAGSSSAPFSQATFVKPTPPETDPPPLSLSASRSYSLALCPQIIYSRSTLIQRLISSKVYRQLEFMAVGSWWVYSPQADEKDGSRSSSESRPGKLLKVPNGREDVFQNNELDFKAKRALMKFLRFIAEYEEQTEIWGEHRDKPFPAFLSEQFKVPVALHAPLLALTLSSAASGNTTTEYALPRIARHLRSIGALGAGFGGIISKWGGLSEICQVGCRASAVGGAVYVLGKGFGDNGEGLSEAQEGLPGMKLCLKDGEAITARWVVGEGSPDQTPEPLCRTITIVSSPLTSLFPPIADEAPPPAAAMVYFPSGSLSLLDHDEDDQELPPVHVSIHTSDSGECPRGQSVIYGSTCLPGETGFQLLELATKSLLLSVDDTPSPTVLCSIRYEQRAVATTVTPAEGSNHHVINFSPTPLDLAFDDSVLDRVQDAWQRIMGDEADEFLVFEDREAYTDDDE